MAPVAGAAERTFPIGKLVDSADDMARLMIVTQYAGTDTVKVYNVGDETEMGHEGGCHQHYSATDWGPNDVNNVDLKSEGTYYAAGPPEVAVKAISQLRT